MERAVKSLVFLLICILSGCTSLPLTNSNLDSEIQAKIDHFCHIPHDTPINRVKRERLLLVGITGYAYRNITNYSRPSDVKNDANMVLERIEEANTAINFASQASSKALFPVYRTDAIIELAEAASVAVRPTFRAGKASIMVSASITVPTGDQIAFAKTALVALLTDELYIEAFSESCKKFSYLTDQEINERLNLRCKNLSTLAGKTGCNLVFQ